MKKRNNRKVRIHLPFLIIFLGFGIIGLRLFQLQVIEHEKYKSLAERARVRVVDISPERGIIYDVNIKPVSVNINSFSLYASPGRISHPEQAAENLALILEGEDKDSVLSKLKRDAVFVWIARKISVEDKRKIEKLNLEGFGFIEEKKRLYPEGELTSHILGWAGIDNQGLSGIEYYYEDKLRGEEGTVLLKRDARGYYIPFTRNALREVVPGQDLVLTIDSKVQSIVEQELSRALKETGAQSVEAIFMHPHTGEIIALANKPDYDPNYWSNYATYERRNRAVQFMYEPGSTFKVFTAAALLEEKLISLEEKIYCDAFLRFGSYTITDWKEFNKEMSFAEIIYNSSSVGMIKAAQRMEKDTFHRYISNFGFGKETGIDLPGEAKGLVKPVNSWYLTDLPCISTGQGIAVTPLQMVVALSAVVNGGNLLRPFVVKGIRDFEGNIIEKNEPYIIRRVISEETSITLREILGYVVKEGTAKKAEVRGYTIGGKTGTAQIPSPQGRGYLQGKYTASFMGFAPVGNPQIAGIVVIKEPAGAYYGGDVAAPVFGRILFRILPLLGIMPQEELWVRK
ncbi:hypothetical protein IBX65_05820 [Candidatus Aerophobetes bacterium]|nr:hypothetical protein [Candidatus Aerophobetes bacterium]